MATRKLPVGSSRESNRKRVIKGAESMESPKKWKEGALEKKREQTDSGKHLEGAMEAGDENENEEAQKMNVFGNHVEMQPSSQSTETTVPSPSSMQSFLNTVRHFQSLRKIRNMPPNIVELVWKYRNVPNLASFDWTNPATWLNIQKDFEKSTEIKNEKMGTEAGGEEGEDSEVQNEMQFEMDGGEESVVKNGEDTFEEEKVDESVKLEELSPDSPAPTVDQFLPLTFLIHGYPTSDPPSSESIGNCLQELGLSDIPASSITPLSPLPFSLALTNQHYLGVRFQMSSLRAQEKVVTFLDDFKWNVDDDILMMSHDMDDRQLVRMRMFVETVRMSKEDRQLTITPDSVTIRRDGEHISFEQFCHRFEHLCRTIYQKSNSSQRHLLIEMTRHFEKPFFFKIFRIN